MQRCDVFLESVSWASCTQSAANWSGPAATYFTTYVCAALMRAMPAFLEGLLLLFAAEAVLGEEEQVCWVALRVIC